MSFIEPLSIQEIFINIFSGNAEIFGALALMVMAGMASYFRMNTLGMFLMIGIFVMMFSGFIGVNFLTIFAIIGGLIVGYIVYQITQ